jgi:hypothetical protein
MTLIHSIAHLKPQEVIQEFLAIKEVLDLLMVLILKKTTLRIIVFMEGLDKINSKNSMRLKPSKLHRTFHQHRNLV